MTQATVRARSAGNSSATNVTSHPATMPTHAADDYLQIAYTIDNSGSGTVSISGTTIPASGAVGATGWYCIENRVVGTSTSMTRSLILAKIAASAAETLTVTTSVVEASQHRGISYSAHGVSSIGADVQIATGAAVTIAITYTTLSSLIAAIDWHVIAWAATANDAPSTNPTVASTGWGAFLASTQVVNAIAGSGFSWEELALAAGATSVAPGSQTRGSATQYATTVLAIPGPGYVPPIATVRRITTPDLMLFGRRTYTA